ncbi:MAG: RNA 2',3'-cyclic phosphodiesterase [Deltaproteobacteria bacterium]|nr:RNA 2',3'-cyclic phosphodiesterase [Deltaproteobacteria bacterium]
METARVFVGCMLDLVTTRRVSDLARALRKRATDSGWSARWVPPPNLHVTLKFLGDTDLGLVSPLGATLAELARRTAPLRLQVSGLDAFPDRDDPRVLFVGISSGHDTLSALAGAVDERLAELGFPREARAFRGHVTLARVTRAGGPLDALCPASSDCGTATVTELSLFRSDGGRPGAEYQALTRHALGVAAPEPPGPTPSIPPPGRP